jgi:hypothetical protein
MGLYVRLDEFEKRFFPLADWVKRRFPFYAHVSISTYGLQFEFPEHHFMGDLDSAFDTLKETRAQIDALQLTDGNMKTKRDEIARLISREKFISRSMVSASFSLVEAFLSGLFFTALHANALGRLACDAEILKFAKNKESAALKERVDRMAKFASGGRRTVSQIHSNPSSTSASVIAMRSITPRPSSVRSWKPASDSSIFMR